MSRHPKRYSAKSLSKEQKAWLGKEIHQRRQTAKELATKYQIPYSTLKRYASFVASGKIMHEDTTGHSLVAAHKKMGALGLLRVQLALQLSMKRYMIQESFKQCGIYPYSLAQVLANCKTKIDSDEERKISGVMDELTEKIRVQGELYDADFD